MDILQNKNFWIFSTAIVYVLWFFISEEIKSQRERDNEEFEDMDWGNM